MRLPMPMFLPKLWCLQVPSGRTSYFPPWSNGSAHTPAANDNLALVPSQDVDFQDDNVEALLVLLCVAHLQFEDILQKVPPKQLLINLAILCDAYMCQDLMRHWMTTWITREWDYGVDPWFKDYHAWDKKNKIRDLKAMMLLSWVFGPVSMYNLFEKGVDWLYLENTKDKISEFPGDWPMPKDLMRNILEARRDTIRDLLAPVHEYLEDLEAKKNDICPEHKRTCKSSLLQEYKRKLRYKHMYPQKAAPNGLSLQTLLWMDLHEYAPFHNMKARKLEVIYCDKPLQDRMMEKIGNIRGYYQRMLWKKIGFEKRPVPNVRLGNKQRRIESVMTNKGWVEISRYPYGTTGYDSDKPYFSGLETSEDPDV